MYLRNIKEVKLVRQDVGGESEGEVIEYSFTFFFWVIEKRVVVENVQYSWIWGRGEEGRC